ncbi:lipase 1-like [Galleria mellonella]|uniref:Lipase n=1 Tax=Galleria mellonella TaxID=7137 RepID=A0ABM3MWC3_GALME|nr:lipase 1-like [Galleria mellonella]
MSFNGHTVSFLLIFSFIILLHAMIIRIRPFTIKSEDKHYLSYSRDSSLNFTELATKYGYQSQEHQVVTEDGYLLKVFRVSQGRNCDGRRRSPPVILMHGLLQSSDSWLDAGPGAALAYLISDACYDLWVANCRGNYYSRRHLKLAPNSSQFWHFSIDEIGFYDVPATIDYVLNYTGAEKVNYIGYSQGAGTFFVMCSERPGYCDKVNVLIALAPATRQINTKSILFRFLTDAILRLEHLLTKYGMYEIFAKGSISQEFLAFFCELNWITEMICNSGQSILDAYHPNSVAEHTARSMFGHFPAGTSVHNMARYGQSMISEDFGKFNYGVDNMRVYGSEDPPLYNLSAVSVPVVIIYGKNDRLVDTKDVEWLAKRLPNVVESFLVEDPYWNHLDVTYSRYTSISVFPKVNEHLLRYSFEDTR